MAKTKYNAVSSSTKAIFNSLGSNYDTGFLSCCIKELFKMILNDLIKHNHSITQDDLKVRNQITNQIIKILIKYNKIDQKHPEIAKKIAQSQINFFYKGRDALEDILTKFNIGQGDLVLTQAFSCYSIEQAIMRTGAQALYADIAPNSVNLSLKSVKKIINENKNIKAIVIQNLLGQIEPMKKIAKICHDHQILIIQDLAQSFPYLDPSQCDALLLSFGRDKIIDAISGGASIILTNTSNNALIQDQQSQKLQTSTTNQLELIDRKTIYQDLIYALLTSMIRSTYKIGFGKLLHYFLKKTGLMTNPIKAQYQNARFLPHQYDLLLNYQLKQLKNNLKHRRQIHQIYEQNFNNNIINNNRTHKSYLRAIIQIEHSQQVKALINYLAKHHIFLADRWYRQAVDYGNLNYQSLYQKNSCPQAEQLAKTNINLPTHQYIDQKKAKLISKLINGLLKNKKN